MKTSLLVHAGVVAVTALLVSRPAAAQERAAGVFLQIFHIGDVETTLTNQAGFAGSVGCGGTGPNSGGDGGDDLIAVLNQALDQDIVDSGLPVEQRRELFRFCDDMTLNAAGGWDGDVASVPDVVRMMQGLAPDELFMQTDQAAQLAELQLANVTQRIAQIRLARRGQGELGGYAFERGRATEPLLASIDALGLRAPAPRFQLPAFAAALERGFSSGEGFFGIEGVSAFVNGQYTRLDASSSSSEVGSEGNGGGVTLGIDKRLGESSFLGLAFGYSYLDTDFDRDFGQSQLHDFTFSLYGATFFTEHVYLDGIVSGSILRFDQERSIPSGVGPAFSDLDSDPEGWNVTGDLGVGGEFTLRPVDLNPYLRVAVSRTEIDGFDESGSTLALSTSDQGNTSVTSRLGLSVSLPVSTGFGVVSPYVRGEYVHEYKDQADEIRGNLRLVPEAGFTLDPNDTDRDYASVGAGATAALGRGISAFADYDVLLGFSNLVVHKATIGGRLEF